MLQEQHADETAFRQALEVAVSEIRRDAGRQAEQRREALNALSLTEENGVKAPSFRLWDETPPS